MFPLPERIHFRFSFKADFPTGINNRPLRVENEPGEIAYPACAESTGGPHLWVIIAHSCMPRDKSEAIRKPALSAVGSPCGLYLSRSSRTRESWRNLTNRGRPSLSVFCTQGLFPLYWNIRPQHYGNYQGNGMSADAAPTRDPWGGGKGRGGLLRPPVIKETQNLSISLSSLSHVLWWLSRWILNTLKYVDTQYASN